MPTTPYALLETVSKRPSFRSGSAARRNTRPESVCPYSAKGCSSCTYRWIPPRRKRFVSPRRYWYSVRTRQESGDVPDPDILLGIDQFARFVRTEALDQSFVNLTIDLVRLLLRSHINIRIGEKSGRIVRRIETLVHIDLRRLRRGDFPTIRRGRLSGFDRSRFESSSCGGTVGSSPPFAAAKSSTATLSVSIG